MNIKPLYDRVVIKRVEEENKTKGGIVIPDTAKEKSVKGTVIAVGKGKLTESGKLVPPAVKKGDMVLLSKYAGNEIKIEGVEHSIMREEDILAVVE